MKRARIVWMLLLLGCAVRAFGGTAPLMDRILFEVNKIGYSQRFFETYLVTKDLLSLPADSTLSYPGPSHWSQLLEQFKVDMLVDQEAKRVGGLNIDKAIINKAHAIILARRDKDPQFAAFLQHMAATEDSLRHVTLSVITIKLFLLRKQGGVDKKDAEIEAGLFGKVAVDEKAAWYVKLDQQTTYRFFENADKYVEIFPGAMGGGGQ